MSMQQSNRELSNTCQIKCSVEYSAFGFLERKPLALQNSKRSSRKKVEVQMCTYMLLERIEPVLSKSVRAS